MLLTEQEIKQAIGCVAMEGCEYVTLEIRECIADARAIEARVIAKIKAQGPVAKVDANDDGYWADILSDNSVKVGQLLYRLPEGD